MSDQVLNKDRPCKTSGLNMHSEVGLSLKSWIHNHVPTCRGHIDKLVQNSHQSTCKARQQLLPPGPWGCVIDCYCCVDEMKMLCQTVLFCRISSSLQGNYKRICSIVRSGYERQETHHNESMRWDLNLSMWFSSADHASTDSRAVHEEFKVNGNDTQFSFKMVPWLEEPTGGCSGPYSCSIFPVGYPR